MEFLDRQGLHQNDLCFTNAVCPCCVLFVQFEESISIDMLQELKDAFVLADIDGNGRLDFDEFKQVFKMQLNITEAKVCFVNALNCGELGLLHLRSGFSTAN